MAIIRITKADVEKARKAREEQLKKDPAFRELEERKEEALKKARRDKTEEEGSE